MVLVGVVVVVILYYVDALLTKLPPILVKSGMHNIFLVICKNNKGPAT